MKYALALSVLAASALAQPHRKHMQHREVHDQAAKRDVVWTTDWVVVTEVVDAVATVFVDEAGHTLSTGGVDYSTATTTSTSADGGNFFQGASTSSTSSTTLLTLSRSSSSTPTPTSTEAASTSSTYVAPAPETTSTSSTSEYVAPTSTPVEQPTSTSTSEYVAPTSTYTPVETPSTTSTYVAPATSSVAAAAAPSSSSSSSGSSSLSAAAASVGCTDGSPCTGAVTYYTAGLGSCGITSDGSTEDIVALDASIMEALDGANPNNNPLCGSTITLTYGGKSVDLTVVDTCPGCSGSYGLDLSEHAFKQLADESVGVFDGEWYFS